MVSVGGRYSNHLHALAWSAKKLGFKSVGLVRGYPSQQLTSTLLDCIEWGMELHFIGHQEYLNRYQDDFWSKWLIGYPSAFRIDEGGWGASAMLGSSMWWEGISRDSQIVVTPIGSGCTYAGLLLSRPSHVDVVGVPVYKDTDNYSSLIAKLLSVGVPQQSIKLWPNFAGRGFGKLDDEQASFKYEFERSTKIQLDPVYTAKTFSALASQLKDDVELREKQIAIIHTGGLQGNRSALSKAN